MALKVFNSPNIGTIDRSHFVDISQAKRDRESDQGFSFVSDMGTDLLQLSDEFKEDFGSVNIVEEKNPLIKKMIFMLAALATFASIFLFSTNFMGFAPTFILTSIILLTMVFFHSINLSLFKKETYERLLCLIN